MALGLSLSLLSQARRRPPTGIPTTAIRTATGGYVRNASGGYVLRSYT